MQIPTEHGAEDSHEEWYNRMINAYMFVIEHDPHLKECKGCYDEYVADLDEAFLMYQIISGMINHVQVRVEESWMKAMRESWDKKQ